MATEWGVTTSGFNKPRLSDCQADLEAGLTQAFGATVNTAPGTVFNQLSAVFAERFALLWEALEQTYNASTVNCEGVSVDNILALNGLLRLPAKATVTDPQPEVQPSGVTLYGLVLYGTPGTVVPQGSLIQTATAPTLSFSLDAAQTIAAGTNAQQQIALTQAPTAGSYTLALTLPSGATVTTPSISYQAQAQTTQLTFPATPSSAFTLTFAAPYNLTTASIPAGATAAQVQSAIANLTGLTNVTVTAIAGGYAIAWPSITQAMVSCSAASATVTQSLQAVINSTVDSANSNTPLADVEVTQPAATLIVLSFGALTPPTGQPSSGKMQQPLVALGTSTLTAGNTAVNFAFSTSVTGAPDAGYGTATCTVTGANAAPAGTLSVIGSGVSGWSGVINQLDAVVGRALETDTEALTRRESLLASRGSGSLPAIVSAVSALDDVTAAIGFANTTNQAQQIVVFSQTATTGSYQLAFRGNPTAQLAYNATAAQVQAALQALTGLGNVSVSGSAAFGLIVDFGGANGNQGLPLLSVPSNSTDASITPYFARAPKSVEIVVQGGDATEVASTIFNSLPAGIASWGNPSLRTLGSTSAGSTQVSLGSVTGLLAGATLQGQGLYPGTLVQSITGNTATVSPAALATASNVPMVATTAATVYDTAGNAHVVQFSRPQSIPVFVVVSLVTDTYLQPGNPSSGQNPNAKFNPATIATIEADILASINNTSIGGTLVARGTDGIANSFRDVVGVLDAQVAFDFTASPTNTGNLTLPPEGLAIAQSFSISVSFS